MTVLAVSELATIILLAVAFLWYLRQQAADLRAREEAWTAERRELLNRIQAPERIPVAAAVPLPALPEHEPDEYGMVGQILEFAEPGAE